MAGERSKSPLAQFLMAVFCDGFTTFSAFSLQTFDLMRDGAWLKGATNISRSVVLCLLCIWAG